MTAYIVADIDVTDPAQYDKYKALAPAAIERYGGRYIARGGESAVLEGDWSPRRVVLLEFPTVEAAKRFHDSPEYRAARDVRAKAAKMNMIVVAGV